MQHFDLMRLNLGIGNHLLGFEKRLNLRINLGIEKTCVCRELTCNIFDATKRHLPEVHFLTHIENAKIFSVQNHTKPLGPGRAGGWGRACSYIKTCVGIGYNAVSELNTEGKIRYFLPDFFREVPDISLVL